MRGALIWYSVLFNIDMVEKSTECAIQKTNGLNMQCSANNKLSVLCMVRHCKLYRTVPVLALLSSMCNTVKIASAGTVCMVV